jgi:hypothetical protein
MIFHAKYAKFKREAGLFHKTALHVQKAPALLNGLFVSCAQRKE